MAGTALYLGQGGADDSTGARLWRLAQGSDDDGTMFDIYGLSNWIRPSMLGDSVFYDAYVTITWSMNVVLRFRPLLDMVTDVVAFAPGAPVQGDATTFKPELTLLAPVSGRNTQTFRIPLVWLRHDSDGNEVGRNYLVGARLRLEVESVGGLTAGALILDGCEVDVEPVQDDLPATGD